MKYKETFKILFFSIATAIVVKYITASFILKSIEKTSNSFHKKLISIDTYQQKIAELFYIELAILFVLPYLAAIAFYFFIKINLNAKNNFLLYIFSFTILFFLSYILISYSYNHLK